MIQLEVEYPGTPPDKFLDDFRMFMDQHPEVKLVDVRCVPVVVEQGGHYRYIKMHCCDVVLFVGKSGRILDPRPGPLRRQKKGKSLINNTIKGV